MVVSLSSMRRARTFGAITAALLLGGVALAAPTSGRVSRMMRHPAVDGVGTVSCNLVGSLSFMPALKVTSTPVPTKATLHIVLNQCMGTGDGANVAAGMTRVSGQLPGNDCQTVLTNASSATPSGPLRWVTTMGTPRLTASTIQLTGGTGSAGPPITVDIGGTATAGSFTGDTSASHIVLAESYQQLANKCLNMHGLRAIHFTVGSTFALSAPAGP